MLKERALGISRKWVLINEMISKPFQEFVWLW